MPRQLAGAAAVFVLLAVTGCGPNPVVGSAQNLTPLQPTTAPRPAVSQPVKPSVPPSRLPTSSPSQSVAPSPPTADTKLRLDDQGPRVLAVQQRLSALGYWLGTPDGKFGDLTQQAVYALQKAADLQRDGIVGPQTMVALNHGTRPTITSKGSGHRVEINKATQLLLIIDGKRITTILNTSTGSGATYLQAGQQEVALTPSGSFHVFRQIDGERIGPLGALWRPKYFNAGIAIHGLSSVPPYPASHGCTRVSIAAMNWIWDTNQVPIGTSVTVV